MSLVEIRKEGSVFHIELNYPEKKNGLDFSMAEALLAAVTQAERDPACRIMVFSSKGRAYFSAGPDLEGLIECAKSKEGARMLDEIISRLNRLILMINGSAKVTIAAIHGYAYGGGFNIMLPCDFRFAEAKTKFIENFYYMGVTPDLGSSYFLPRLIGWTRTKELLLTGRLFTAREAEEWGLFTEVVEKRAEMMKRVETLCERVLSGDAETLPGMKELFSRSFHTELAEHLDREKTLLIDSLLKPSTVHRLEKIKKRSWLEV